jgi:hypothetical protein
MTDVTLGDRTVSLPDLPRLDLSRPDVSLPDLPVRELSLPAVSLRDLSLPDISLPEISLADLRRRSTGSPPMLPMVLVTLVGGLVLGIAVAALAWSFAPVRQTAQRIRGRIGGPSWTNSPEPEFLENPIAVRHRERDSSAASAAPTSMAPAAKPATATPAAATPSATPKAASPNGSSPAGRPVSRRSTVALDPGQP